MNDTSGSPSVSDPVKAFKDLAAEVRVLRSAVEDWHDEVKKDPAPHYAAKLEEHTTQFTKIGYAFRDIMKKLESIEKFPAAAEKALLDAGNNMFYEARVKVDNAASQINAYETTLRHLVGAVKERKQQRESLIHAGVGGLLAGLILFYVLARALPLGVSTYIAASIIGENRWDAGLMMMQKSNPEGWQKLMNDANLVSANREKIEACRTTAAKTKQDQNCAITVASDNGR